LRAPCRIACCWWSSARCARSARADRPAPPRRRWRGRRLPMASNCSFASTEPNTRFRKLRAQLPAATYWAQPKNR
jgi:hypothetical protein